MSYFAVTREAGPAWTPGGIFEQPAVNEHAAFMNALADEGFLLFMNRLGNGHGRTHSGFLRQPLAGPRSGVLLGNFP